MSDFLHLTWRGRAEWIWYAVRRVFIKPAPYDERCYMGAPVHPSVHCPRYAVGLWCAKHGRRLGQ